MSSALACNITIVCTQDSANLNEKFSNISSKCLWTCATGTSDELHPLAVQMICATLEGWDTETNATVRFRRLVTACRILMYCGVPAKSLVQDLGFGDMISSVLMGATLPTKLGSDEEQLLKYMNYILST
jgi:hypothetical protein